ncbi:hypothetical protein MKK69_02965 [Methylobacterium sp. J-026]|uniref:hypothetical protein n=1 Tax=Methylobacterium sp. J-026 TaxID=2836624 RepID=UPI001FB8B5A7|nr:hypothetical protein [Methylobacterium sp. J-026]MCJ2133036.1 hypothetical protein [Methylobacterium sp. J-026]
MRIVLAAALLAGLAAPAWAGEPPKDGPVTGGSFGMGGSDYYGDVRDRMPFTRAAPPRPIGIADIERVRAARRRAETRARRVGGRHALHRRPPHA